MRYKSGENQRRYDTDKFTQVHNYACVFMFICSPFVCGFLCVYYHLHRVCEHHTVEANEVLVVQGVHGVDLTDKVLQSVGLTEHVRL